MMKRFIPVVLVLLLYGCALQPAPMPPPATQPAPTEPAPVVSIYDPDSGLERDTAGAIRVYPLGQSDSTARETCPHSYQHFPGNIWLRYLALPSSPPKVGTHLSYALYPSSEG